MNKKTFNIQDIFKKVNFSPVRIDRMRLEKLESIKSAQQARNAAYEKEKQRLVAKYGANHHRVKKMQAKMEYNQGFINALDIEIDNASIEVPSFDKKTWMVYGRVVNKKLKGIKGLTVSLYDNQGKWIKQLGYSCTDERGFYSLIYSPGESEKQQIPEDKELFLTVSDKQRSILHRESDPLFVEIGQIDTRMIVITDQQETCTPPERQPKQPGPGKEETGPTPGSQEWKVKGIVKTKKNKPIKGVTIALYDNKDFSGKPIRTGLSGEDGTFEFIFKDKKFQALLDKQIPVYLRVDSKGETRYSSEKGVLCEPGGEAFFDLQLPPKPTQK